MHPGTTSGMGQWQWAPTCRVMVGGAKSLLAIACTSMTCCTTVGYATALLRSTCTTATCKETASAVVSPEVGSMEGVATLALKLVTAAWEALTCG